MVIYTTLITAYILYQDSVLLLNLSSLVLANVFIFERSVFFFLQRPSVDVYMSSLFHHWCNFVVCVDYWTLDVCQQ